MAIFKKIFINENSSQNGKITSNNTITNNTTSITDKQTTQTNPLTSSCSSYNENISLNDNENQEKIPEDLENICCHIYFRLLKRSEIRLIIFSEKSFRLLYDSDTVVAVSDRIVAGSHKSQCGRFQFLPHKNDTIRIAKMLFGTLPTSLNSDSLKIHSLRDCDSIMVSRVFSIPKFGKYSSPFKTSDLYKCMVGSLSSTDSDNQSNYSTIRSLEGIRDKDGTNPGRFPLITSKTFTNPDPPEKFVRVRNSSLQLESNAMDDLMMDELRAFSPNRLSRTRRRQLSQFGMDESLSIRVSNRSRLSSCSSIADGGASDSSAECHQGYGLALILPNEFRPFIFQHIIQIESELDILAIQIHKAVQDKSQFFQQISQGWINICDSLCLLCNSLRLKTPVWLSLASSETSKKELIAADFCDTLFYLNNCLNTKETKFFLSTLLSAILMNQLTWVASVAPPEKCSYDHRSLLLGMNVIDTKQMFYNPTIAQLLELYYGIGTANGEIRRFTKIVVVGENLDLTGKLLQVLSYFIRCSSVESRRNETLEICVSDDEEYSFDFGHSLLAGICASYSPHFVLSGIQAKQESFSDIISSIFEDARHPMGEPCTNSKLMLSLSPTNSNALATSTGSGNQQTNVKLPAGISSPEKLIKPQLQERKDSLIVFIDMYGFVVRIISAENCQIDDVPFVCPSDAITSMLEEFAELYGYKCAPDFLLSFIEDKLGALLLKSNVLVNLVTTGMEEESLSMERVSSILDCSISDLRLILNIASVWAPGIQTTAL